MRRGALWSEMVDLIDAHEQNGFLIYFWNDVHPVMSVAGDRADCIAYEVPTALISGA